MTKEDLIASVASAAGITLQQAKKAVSATFDAVLDDAKSGTKVVIHGFGSFELKEIKEKGGMNPKTGEKIQIPAKKTIRFKFSKAAENEINGK